MTDEAKVTLVKDRKNLADVPTLYFNGFELSGSLSDLRCVLMHDGKPTVVLSCSFTTGKTVAENFGATISGIEKASGNTIMNMEDLRQAFEKATNSSES